MSNATEQIFLPSSSGTQASTGLQKPANPPPVVNLENVEDFSKVCRVCAAITELVMPIFSAEGLQNNLADKINKYLPIKVVPSDSPALPVVVCYQCASTLLATHELAQCSAQADAALRTRSAALRAQKSKPSVTTPSSNSNKPSRSDHEPSQSTNEPSRGDNNSSTGPCKTEGTDEGAERRCTYCPARVPTARYRAHLRAQHAGLVFHCEECDSLVSRRMFLLHMTTHAAQYEAQDAADLPPGFAPPTPAQDLAAALRSLLCDPTPFPDEPNDLKTERPTDRPATVLKTETRARNSPVATPAPVKRERRATSVKPEPPAPAPSTPPEPAGAPAGPTPPAAEAEAAAFSDHSEGEDGFGPLPQSVFAAIEDSQEAPPRARTGPDRKRERACPHCGKVYRAASSYFYHLKYFHKRSKEHECGECGARFGTRGALREHASRHTGERALACPECDKRFRSRASLYIHRQTHGAAKEWSCAECGRAFRWRAQLRRHEARHAGARAHACAACPRAFSVRADLLRHARTHARAEHACPVAPCAALFAQPRYLRAHLAKKHPDAPRDVA